jgi:hypothetical protein
MSNVPIEPSNGSDITIPAHITTVQQLEDYANETGQDPWELLWARGMVADVVRISRGSGVPAATVLDAVEGAAGEAAGAPYRAVSNVLGELRVGGHTFPYRRVDYREQDGPDFSSYRLDIEPHQGEVAVERTGMQSEGPWGVDLYRAAEGADSRLTADQAREWAHALLGAADLADQFNRDGVA